MRPHCLKASKDVHPHLVQLNASAEILPECSFYQWRPPKNNAHSLLRGTDGDCGEREREGLVFVGESGIVG